MRPKIILSAGGYPLRLPCPADELSISAGRLFCYAEQPNECRIPTKNIVRDTLK
jgi:hypothetical protein